MTYYLGARIFHDGRLLENHVLQVEHGKTKALFPQSALPANAPVKSLHGGILTAGFVETQANGGGGVLVNEDFSLEGLAKVAAAHREYGTVAILPTFITDSQAKYHQAIASVAAAVKHKMKGVVGGHFEGPFISRDKKGTHNPSFIRTPDDADFACFAQYADDLQHSLITLAPECLPAGTIKRFKPMIPQINVAHSMANHEDLERAVSEGLTGVTHLYNAMRPIAGRDPSVLGAAMALGLKCGIIVDGVHAHPYSLQLAYKALGAEGLLLVTDSMHTIGTDIESFDLMGIKVYVQGNKLVNEEGSLAGAHIDMLSCVQNAVRMMKADTESALRMAVSTPAYYLNRPDLAKITGREVDDVIYLTDELKLEKWI
ncbi:MAG: N-acetylglucosamine-6-phosphate deacetylase [Cardiobacteriaceae bacterium]|nr:N-acetylglucosamine-6-phosphate deacetylase [Cardiobacteriaceae bacterium]